MEPIDLKSCPNVRDLGGSKGLDGRTVRRRILIRASKPVALTPEDERTIKESLRVKTIIDLRTEKETLDEPDADLGCDYRNIPLRPDVREGIKYKFPTSPKEFVKKFPSMPQMYVNMLTTEFSVGQLKKIFSLIFDAAKKGECVLFHCSEGKDRTGIVASLAEMMLGVGRDEIMCSYMLSNEFFKKRNSRYYALTVVLFADRAFAREFKKMYEAHPSMLQSVFSIVDGAGGIDAYFTDKLGFTREDLDAFRDNMLVGE